MRLNELTQNLFVLPQLNEGISDDNLKIIEKECQPFIHEIGGIDNLIKYPMYRGSQTKNVDLTLKRSYIGTIRLPESMPPHMHTFLNEEFKYMFGVPFRNGYFATGNERFAGVYGDVHYCIPRGEFKYCWSPEIKDLYIAICDGPGNLFSLTDNAKDILRDKLSTYKTTNLLDGIKSGNEIMLYNENYYLVAK